MKNLITTAELRKLGRPIGKVADDKLEAFINEAEQLHIKPIIGDKLYLDLQKEVEVVEDGEKNEALQLLLNGGTYFENGDFSDRLSSKERSDAYNNTLEAANAFLKECLAYCREKELITSAGKPTASLGGIYIKKIG